MNAHIPNTDMDYYKRKSNEELLDIIERLAGEAREYPGDYHVDIEMARRELLKRLPKGARQ